MTHRRFCSVASKKKLMRVEEIEWYQERPEVVIAKCIAGGTEEEPGDPGNAPMS